MTLMWVYDICKEDDYDIALRKKYDEITKTENELKDKALDLIVNISDEILDKHIPRLD